MDTVTCPNEMRRQWHATALAGGERARGRGDVRVPEWTTAMSGILALGYLRHIRAARQATEKGSPRAAKGLDDVAPRAMVAPGPVGPRSGGTNDGR